jgi:isoleucyl-tRNA synthetase
MTRLFYRGRGPVCGLFIDDANKEVVQELEARGALLHIGFIKHQYPIAGAANTP